MIYIVFQINKLRKVKLGYNSETIQNIIHQNLMSYRIWTQVKECERGNSLSASYQQDFLITP